MVPFDAPLQAAMDKTADELNQVLPDGLVTDLKTVSIVELQFAGNVVREIYRINLDDGSVLDVATDKTVGNR
jgi:hypothetical protein